MGVEESSLKPFVTLRKIISSTIDVNHSLNGRLLSSSETFVKLIKDIY